MRDEHVSKDEIGQPCMTTSNGTSNELSGSHSVTGRLCQQFQGSRYNGVPGWDVPGMVQCIL